MKKLISILFVIITAGLSAQQLPQFTQYMINDYVLNPAIGGSRNYFDAKANQRLQWVGVTDAPRTFVFSLHGPLQNNKVGLGGYIYSDITGPTRRTGARFSYAYHFKVTEKTKLSLGVSGGMMQYLLDGSQLTLEQQNDLALSNSMQSVVIPDAAAGLYLYNQKFFFSLSAPQLLNTKLQFFEDYENTVSRLSQHFYAMGGYNFQMGVITLQPSFLVRFVDPLIAFEGGLKATYNDLLWLGATFRQDDGVGALLGYNINSHFSFAYSYDIPLYSYSTYSNGSHEIMLQIKFLDK